MNTASWLTMPLLFLLTATLGAVESKLMGWRGDNQGHYQGSGFPTTWTNGKNLAWNIEMPGWGLSQPIVVQDVVITTAESDLVIGVDAHSRKVRWQRSLYPFLFSGATSDTKRATEMLRLVQVAAFTYGNPEPRGRWAPERFTTWHAHIYLPSRWVEIKCAFIKELASVFPDWNITHKDGDLHGKQIYWSPEGARLNPAYPCVAAPAIVGDRIYYRTAGSMLCIAAD